RLVVQLLSLSYLEARLSGRNHVLIGDIVKASLSSSYALNREDVKQLKSFAATGSMPGRLRPDLICPLDAPHSYMANVVSAFKEKRALQMEAKVVEASLTVAERDTLKSTDPGGVQQRKKVPVRMVAPQASDEELAANFMTLIPKPKK
ncbi:MAG: transposase, partial [Pseudomonadaceae bacterium]|nr:transposase [Pseudomonadaceae bacterium]